MSKNNRLLKNSKPSGNGLAASGTIIEIVTNISRILSRGTRRATFSTACQDPFYNSQIYTRTVRMATVTVITGLCGSGKSEYLKQMTGVISFDEGVRPDQPTNMQKFLDVLEMGKDCAIVEIAYIAEHWRNELVRQVTERFPDTIFKWVYFENDLEKANANCLNDPKRSMEAREGNLRLNTRWTESYSIPEGADVLKIFPLPALSKESDRR